MKITEGSSLYNIDLAGGLFASYIFPEEELLILFNDQPNISYKNKYFRTFISRHSIPTLYWEFSSDEVWRLKHIPFVDNNIRTLLALLNNYIAFYKNLDLPNTIDQQSFLGQIYKDVSRAQNKKDLLLIYSNLIINLFSNINSKNKFKLIYSGGSKTLNTSDFNSNALFFDSLRLILKTLNNGTYEFAKGGLLIINYNKMNIEINRVIKDNFNFIFYNDKDNKHKFNINFEDFISADFSKYNVSCLGPLKLVPIQNFGTLCHLPWYIPGRLVSQKGNYNCLEFISPIPASSKNRISNFYNQGGNQKLLPTGFSLIEYNHSNVLKLISNLLQINLPTFQDLESWLHLLNNYPESKEKLSEYQGSVKSYIHQIIKQKENSLIRGETVVMESILLNYNSFLKAGEFLTSIEALTNYLRKINIKKNDIYFSNQQIKFLNKFLNHAGQVDLNKLLTISLTIIDSIGIILINCGYPPAKWNSTYELFKSNYNKFVNNYFIFIDQTNTTSPFNNIFKINKIFRSFSTIYYSFVAFFIGTVLKANIFTSYLVLGNDYGDKIQALIQARHQNKYLAFEPLYFNKIKLP